MKFIIAINSTRYKPLEFAATARKYARQLGLFRDRRSFPPRIALFHFRPNEQHQQRGQSADEKHRPPAPARKDEVETDRGQKVAERVSLLEQAGKKAAQPGWNLFHGERGAHAPLSAHADAEQRAQHEEGGETMREAG